MYDIRNLGKLKLLDADAPETMKAFREFDKAAMAAGAIPVCYNEPMAVAVALTMQCPYCLELHARRARAAIVHGTHAMATNCQEAEA